MVLGEYFLSPMGLTAVAAAIPLVLLYLLKPEPSHLRLPTIQFLLQREDDDRSNAIIERLQRDPLLLLQLFVILLTAMALATPYVTVAERTTIDETVIVLDASASMATQGTGPTRFDQAIQRATAEIGGTTTIVVGGESPRIRLRRGPAAEAERILNNLRVTHTPGNLADAISTASRVAGNEARLVVISDFADASEWQTAIDTARAEGYRVDMAQVAGGSNAVGIVDYAFRGGNVSVSVKNYADTPLQRTLRLGAATRDLRLAPGDVVTRQLPVPPDGGTIRLDPTDGFAVDDRVPIATPRDPRVEILVLTNTENRFLTTALSVMKEVDLTVKAPPITITNEYDVIVFSNVNPERLLQGNIRAARETLERGGGVVIQAQPGLDQIDYGDLLLVEPTGLGNGTSVSAAADPLTDGIAFSPPEEYIQGDLTTGRTLVAVDDSPLIATASVRNGRVLYYGYIEEASGFKYNYRYPVFWQRLVRHLTGRQTLAQLNRQTGTRLSFAAPRPIEDPMGSREATSVRFDRVGQYQIGEQQYAAALASEPESNVSAPDRLGAGGRNLSRETEERQVPRDLSHFAVLGGLLVVFLELVVLRRRGDL